MEKNIRNEIIYLSIFIIMGLAAFTGQALHPDTGNRLFASAYSAVCELILCESPNDEVIAGRDGWLYYSATLDDYRHLNNCSDRQLFSAAHNLALIQEYVISEGAGFLFVLAPNKNSLYPSHMPRRYNVFQDQESDAARLLYYLSEEGVNSLDLFKLFNGQQEELYYRRDSHWTEKGAALVYRSLMEKLGIKGISIPSSPIGYERMEGDLDRMLYPVWGFDETREVFLDGMSWRYINEAGSVEDDLIETVNPYGKGSLLMFRDSFGNSLIPYLAETFGDAVFSRIQPYGIEELDPGDKNAVIIEKVERHLSSLWKAPPVMGAVKREDLSGDIIEAEGSAGDAVISEEAGAEGFLAVSGHIPGTGETGDRILILAGNGDGGSAYYEAFLTGDGESGYGYKAYIPKRDFPDGLEIRGAYAYRGGIK